LDAEPWQIVEGIEYRSMTVLAWKGKEGPCIEKNQAVIYKGPWKTVTDDDGHELIRGERMAVCEKTFEIMNKAPYAEHIIPVPAQVAVEEEIEFNDCGGMRRRDPKETKAGIAPVTTNPDQGSSCC